MKSLPDFADRGSYHVYVDKISSYYATYPEDRESGPSQILSEMALPPGLTIDQIHAKLNAAGQKE